MTMIETFPLPVTDNVVDAGFWRACADGRLTVQTCRACGHVQHPPRAMCPACRSTELGWRDAAGTGRIWSFTVAHPPLLPAFAALAPHAVALVELDDVPGIRMVGALLRDGAAIAPFHWAAARAASPRNSPAPRRSMSLTGQPSAWRWRAAMAR